MSGYDIREVVEKRVSCEEHQVSAGDVAGHSKPVREQRRGLSSIIGYL